MAFDAFMKRLGNTAQRMKNPNYFLVKGARRRSTVQSVAFRVNCKPSQGRRWATGPEIRQMLNVSAVTIWRWRRKCGFPTAKVINGRLYFAWDDVEAWMEKQSDSD
jgi:predicted DNA-binding transcriptional regulator AlpA